MFEFLYLVNKWIVYWLLFAGCVIGAYEHFQSKDFLWASLQLWVAATLFYSLWR